MKNKEVPDGGWGWMVVLGVALTNMVNQALISVFGLIFREKIEDMGHETVGAALVVNLGSMITNFSGLLTGPILKNYSSRSVTIVGVLLTSAGMILSSTASNIVHLIISYSIFTGLGLGLIWPSTFMAVNGYFTTKKSQAVGISMVGTGVGQMLMPQVVHLLLSEYGYRGTTLILGALCLNGLPGALLLHPVKWHMKETVRESLLLHDKIESNPIKEERTFLKKLKNMFDLKLLEDPVFLHIILGLAVGYTCSVAFGMIFPYFLEEEVGLSRAETATAMSSLSAADIIARLTLPAIAGRLHLGSRMTFLIGLAAVVCSRSLFALQDRFVEVLILSMFCGYVRGAIIINQNLTVSEYCTDETKLPTALGLNMVGRGIAVLTIGQFFGWVRDFFGSYSLCIHVQSVAMAVVVLTWTAELLYRKGRTN